MLEQRHERGILVKEFRGVDEPSNIADCFRYIMISSRLAYGFASYFPEGPFVQQIQNLVFEIIERLFGINALCMFLDFPVNRI